jgi:hypothetical protein
VEGGRWKTLLFCVYACVNVECWVGEISSVGFGSEGSLNGQDVGAKSKNWESRRHGGRKTRSGSLNT